MAAAREQLDHIVKVILGAGDDQNNIFRLIAAEAESPADILDLESEDLNNMELKNSEGASVRDPNRFERKRILALKPFYLACPVGTAWTDLTRDDFEQWRATRPSATQAPTATTALGKRQLEEIIGPVKESINELAESVKHSQTVERGMSNASGGFGTDLLLGLSISWQKADLNQSVGAGPPVGVFSWKKETTDEKKNISEPAGTPGALEWLFGKLEQDIALDGEKLGFRDVKGKLLASLKANGMAAKGKSDGCISEESVLKRCDRTGQHYYSYGIGLVELKTDRSDLNMAQPNGRVTLRSDSVSCDTCSLHNRYIKGVPELISFWEEVTVILK